MGKIYTRFQTKTAQKPYPLGWHIPILAYIREWPPGSATFQEQFELFEHLFNFICLTDN